MTSRTLRYYFAFSSPFAALADSRVDTIASEHGFELIPRAVMFPPVGPPPDDPRRAFLAFKASHQRDDCRRQAVKQGYDLRGPAYWEQQHWPGDALPDFTNATAGWFYALERGGERAYRNTLFRMVWTQGRLPTDMAALMECAIHAGLPAAGFRSAMESSTYREQIAPIYREMFDDRVWGVPTFVIRGRVIWGNDHVDELLEVLSA